MILYRYTVCAYRASHVVDHLPIFKDPLIYKSEKVLKADSRLFVYLHMQDSQHLIRQRDKYSATIGPFQDPISSRRAAA